MSLAAQIEPARKALKLKRENDQKRPPDVWVPETGPGCLSLDEFGRLFRICRGEIYKLRRKGRLRFSKIGSRSLITFDEVRRFQKEALITDAPRAADTR